MPTYEYRCKKCKKHFEYFQKMTDAPIAKCPDCGGELKRLVSAASFALKGGGWYKDGYSSSSSSQPKKEGKKKNG